MGWLTALIYGKIKAIVVAGVSALGGGSIAVPVLVTGDQFEKPLFREFNPKPADYKYTSLELVQASDGGGGGEHTNDQSSFTNFPTVTISNSQLIKGTKSYNDGNYVIYFGSEACPNCNNFLYSDRESPKIWIGTNQKDLYSNGIFFETYSLARHKKEENTLNKVKFIFFSDEVPSMDNRNNDDLYTIPWNTWSNTLTSQGRIEGDYVRNDESAVNFRKLHSLFLYYFGQKVKGIPTIVIYRNGVPFVYDSDKLEHIEEEKKKTGEQITALKDATHETSRRAAILRYDLFKHLKYIYGGELLWWL